MLDDLRFAIRQFRRRPAVSGAAVVTLALGLGLTTVAFTAINSLFIKGNAGTRVDGTGWIFATSPGVANGQFSPAEFERIQTATQDVLVTAAAARTTLAWRQGAGSDTVWALLVSSNYFDVIKAGPRIGRLPTSPDEVLVGEAFWRERLGAAAPASVQLTLNGVTFGVVGVMPESFSGPDGTFAPELWVPLAARRDMRLPESLDAIDNRWLGLTARLGDGRRLAEAEARLHAAAAAMKREWPDTHRERRARFVAMRDGHPEVRTLRPLAWAAMLGVGCVLLLACVNVGAASALGAVVRVGADGTPRPVIGVARDTLHRDFTSRDRPVLFVPLTDADYDGVVTIVVRTASAPGSLVPAVHDAIAGVDPAVPALSVRTMAERLEMPRWPMWTASGFFGACGSTALVLAIVGLFAVISQTVTQRRREFGLRVALGASSGTLLRDVFARGGSLVLPGVALGIAAAAGVAQLITATFPGIGLWSPGIYAAVAALQALVACAACLAPALRAARVDPLTALRAD